MRNLREQAAHDQMVDGLKTGGLLLAATLCAFWFEGTGSIYAAMGCLGFAGAAACGFLIMGSQQPK